MMRHILQPVIRNTRTGVRSFHVPKDCRPATMDEVIVPSGCWKEANAKRMRKANLQFAAGIIILGATIAFGRVTGLLWLNYKVPVPKKAEE
ncbi:uncharacterized protein LOC108626673 [Ceratina calcarata]|uniref:Uncharacterized protein LOC108626673 n=1 Tax=Ceratina calcarata TaxID=156304 RepID=A0AAJ7J337_9HYME|nr:uncharacterized protein LOC108626673 [Ceratina calcarata]